MAHGRHHYGEVCSEWLSYADLTTLPLVGIDGSNVCATEVFSMPLGGGGRFRDIVHWRQQSDGQLRFTPLYSPRELTTDRKDQILVLALHLVCNYPRLLYVAMASAEVRFIATPVEHPASAFVEVAQRRNFAWILGHMGLPSGPRWNPKKTCNGVFR